MRVLVFAADRDDRADLCATAAEGKFKAVGYDAIQDLCSALYRDPDAIAVILSTSEVFASDAVREFRFCGVKNLLFVLLKTEDCPGPNRARVLVCGADDVQPSPIDRTEYIFRLQALERRYRPHVDKVVSLPNDTFFIPGHCMVKHPSGTILLTSVESSVFDLIVQHGGTVVTKRMVLDYVYDGRDEPQDKVIEVFICKIRKKLEAALCGVDVIETVWGRGYRFVPGGFVPNMSNSRRTVG